jgi:hypothetical protein
MSLEIQRCALRDVISQFLTPTKISEIATENGFSSKANFTPNEYAYLLERTTTIVLEKLQNNPRSQDQKNSKETVISIVDETLSKECKRIPEDGSFPDMAVDITSHLWNLWASFLSKIGNPLGK